MKLTDIFKQDPLAVLKERGLYEDALQAFEAERKYYKISQAHQQDYLMIVQLVARANPNIDDMLLLTSVMQQPAGPMQAIYRLNKHGADHLRMKYHGAGHYDELHGVDYIIEAAMKHVMIAIAQQQQFLLPVPASPASLEILQARTQIKDEQSYKNASYEAQALFLAQELVNKNYMLDQIKGLNADNPNAIDNISNDVFWEYRDFLAMKLPGETELEKALRDTYKEIVQTIKPLVEQSLGPKGPPSLHLV